MPVLDVIWSMLWFFLFVAWFWVVISVVADVFRSKDLGGFAKAIWVLFIILIPWLGVLTYVLIRGQGIADRNIESAVARENATRSYIQYAAGATLAADELKKLADLNASGVISDAEFASQKAKLLG